MIMSFNFFRKHYSFSLSTSIFRSTFIIVTDFLLSINYDTKFFFCLSDSIVIDNNKKLNLAYFHTTSTDHQKYIKKNHQQFSLQSNNKVLTQNVSFNALHTLKQKNRVDICESNDSSNESFLSFSRIISFLFHSLNANNENDLFACVDI